ncbi:uncharacterized protein LOC116241458 [Phasianus colchicus]|uniref:uncharacterized protein LOC116241458 n=1 Tax=Phasianus colchicus TaxID=9054 RepID=UPI00129E7246|nr:uncharacterized protein LOC116241458 [Phasianus colchicus]
MEGPDALDPERRGMIPRAVHRVFQGAQELADKGWQYRFSASFLEIYNESLRDLLGARAERGELEIRRVSSASEELHVPNLRCVPVASEDEVNDRNLLCFPIYFIRSRGWKGPAASPSPTLPHLPLLPQALKHISSGSCVLPGPLHHLPVQHLPTLRQKVLPCVQPAPPLLRPEAVSSAPVRCWEQRPNPSSSQPPFRKLQSAPRSPLSLLFSRLTNPSSP